MHVDMVGPEGGFGAPTILTITLTPWRRHQKRKEMNGTSAVFGVL
jgi:hypothetical protein